MKHHTIRIIKIEGFRGIGSVEGKVCFIKSREIVGSCDSYRNSININSNHYLWNEWTHMNPIYFTFYFLIGRKKPKKKFVYWLEALVLYKPEGILYPIRRLISLLSKKTIDGWVVDTIIKTISHESIHNVLGYSVGIIESINFDRIARYVEEWEKNAN